VGLRVGPQVLGLGWSEPAAANAPVEDESVQPVLRMNILPARRDFFFHLLSAPKFSTYPRLPTTYQAHPPRLPPPTYLPLTNPTPLHSIAKAPETSNGYGAGARAMAVEQELEWLELEWLELERDPCAHEKVRCLRFFLFFLFFLFEEGLRSLLLPLSLLHCSLAVAQQRRRPYSSSVLQQKKKAFFFFFLSLCCTTA